MKMTEKKYGILIRDKNEDTNGLVHCGGDIKSFDSIKGATKRAIDWVEYKTWEKEEGFYGASIVLLNRNYHKMNYADSNSYSSLFGVVRKDINPNFEK